MFLISRNQTKCLAITDLMDIMLWKMSSQIKSYQYENANISTLITGYNDCECDDDEVLTLPVFNVHVYWERNANPNEMGILLTHSGSGYKQG